MTLHVNVTYSDCCFKGHPFFQWYWLHPDFIQLVYMCYCWLPPRLLNFLSLLFMLVCILIFWLLCLFIYFWLLFHDPLNHGRYSSQYLALCSPLFVSSPWMFYMFICSSVCTLQVCISSGLLNTSIERLKEFPSLFDLLLPTFHLLCFSLFYHHT